jgi:glycosyltransferase involved in cell wall biosynthesis
MKILMLIDRLDVGGAESHLVTLTRALRERGHTVHIFAERGAWSHRAREAGAVCYVPPAHLTGRGFFAAVLPCVLFLRRLMRHNGYDILHAHTRRTASLLRLAGRPPFCARVVTCHARFSPRHRRLCYWGDATVAVSEDLLAHLVDTFALPRRYVRVIPNGVDTHHFSPAGRSESPGDWRVTFASRLDHDCSSAARHLLSLCEEWQERLLAQGKRLSVTVLGGGEAFEELCKQASAVNERAGRALVHMAGAVDDPAPVLRKTDLFVGVSRAAVEALFCGATVLLAGDEGMAGLLTADNFERASKTNFCCRGMTPLTREGLDALLPPLPDKPVIVLREGFQPGIYKAVLVVPLDYPEGTFQLKACEYTRKTPLSMPPVELAPEPYREFCKLAVSDDFTVYSGEWGELYASTWELHFTPADGGESRCVNSQLYLMQGWSRWGDVEFDPLCFVICPLSFSGNDSI